MSLKITPLELLKYYIKIMTRSDKTWKLVNCKKLNNELFYSPLYSDSNGRVWQDFVSVIYSHGSSNFDTLENEQKYL